MGELVGFSFPLEGLTSRLLPTFIKETMQLSVDSINSIQKLLTAVFAIATVFSFLSLLLIVASFFLQRNKAIIYANFVVAGLAAGFVSGGFIGADLIVKYVASRTNRIFRDFNVHAELGSMFLGVSIAAAVFSCIVFLYWLVRVILLLREKILVKIPSLSKVQGLMTRKKATDEEAGTAEEKAAKKAEEKAKKAEVKAKKEEEKTKKEAEKEAEKAAKKEAKKEGKKGSKLGGFF